MSNFDEKSGLAYCKAPWGQWAQTVEDVVIEVQLQEPSSARSISCDIKPRHLAICVAGKEIIKGSLFGTVVKDECVWTLEDRTLLRIVLVKSHKDASNCWKSLLEGQFEGNAWEVDQMEKKLTLERFQNENPGFDFSGADISGNYHKGGPKME